MNQLDEVVKWTMKLESELETRLGAEGRGLHEKTNSVEYVLGDGMARTLRRIASIRNKAMHEDGYEVEDLDAFINECAGIYERLLEMETKVSPINNVSTTPVYSPLVTSRGGSNPFLWQDSVPFSFSAIFGWMSAKKGYGIRSARGLAIGVIVAIFVLPPFFSTLGFLIDNPEFLPVFIAFGAVGAGLLYRFAYTPMVIHKKWESWPIIEDYWSQHPKCKTEAGTKCNNCNSRTIRNLGWVNASDNRRIYRCGQCDTVLYRTIR